MTGSGRPQTFALRAPWRPSVPAFQTSQRLRKRPVMNAVRSQQSASMRTGHRARENTAQTCALIQQTWLIPERRVATEWQ
jgi:hypothetical protein